MINFLRRVFSPDPKLLAENQKLNGEVVRAFEIIAHKNAYIEALEKQDYRRRDKRGRYV